MRFPAVALLLTVALSVPVLLRVANFEVSSETRILLEGDQRNLSSYEKVTEILTDGDVLVVSLECAEVFSPEGIEAIRRVSEAFAIQPDVVDVKSLTHSSKPVRRGFSFEMVPLVSQPPVSSNELAALKAFSLQHPLIRDVMVSSDSQHTLITVTYRRDLSTPEKQTTFRAEIDAILNSFKDEGLRFQKIALPLIEQEIRSTLRSDILSFLPAAMLLMTTILWFVFRSWRIFVLVCANQTAALLLLPGLIQISGYSLSVFSILIFPLLTGIQLTLLIHLFTSLQRVHRPGAAMEETIARMLDEIFKPCLFAALTTLIGLASLTLSDVRQVREFGILGALGISLIFLVTFGPGIAILRLGFVKGGLETIRSRVSQSDPGSSESRTVALLAAVPVQYPKTVVAIAALALITAAFGMRLIRTDIRAVEFLSPHSPTRKAVEEFDKVYGGINVVQLDLDSGSTNGVNTLPFLRFVESLQQYAEAQPGVSGVYSYSQLLAMINQIWEGGRADALKLPDNVWMINLFTLALKTQNFPFLTALADSDLRKAHLIIRTPDMPSDRFLAIVENVLDYAQKHRPETVSVSAAKGVHSILEADRRILDSQRTSALTTLLVVGVVLSILWKSPWLAGLTLLTNAVPVAFVIALAGYLNVPLNSITIMVAAISLGISVDDSIHFITHWRTARSRGKTTAEAILETFQIKAKPIISTSAILITLLTVFWLSSFPPVIHFGILSAAAFVGALAGTLFLLPAVLFWCRR